MKILYEKVRAVLLVLFGLIFIISAGISLADFRTARAASQSAYYYSQLTPEAKKFYDAIGEMDASGALKSGSEGYDLVSNGVLTAAQLNSVASSSDVMVAFGAARDAYSLDHPEVFYIDFTRLSVNIGTKNGEYVATLGTGRADSYYIEDGFNSESEVNAAQTAFETAVREIVSAASAENSAEEKIAAVNGMLVQKITYSFCATADSNGTTYEAGAAHIRSPYGALVVGKAVCEGYARAFKVIMDRLQIDCVLVQGYAGGENYEPHMWNYVRLDGNWYGVDVTWNDTTGREEDYLLRGNVAMRTEHIPDGVISESGYEFVYPELHPYDYGVTEDPNGLNIKSDYYESDTPGAMLLQFTVSYGGKSATKLAEDDGRYIVQRYGTFENGEFSWSVWLYIGTEDNGKDEGSCTVMMGMSPYTQYVQFAIIDYAPDGILHFDYVQENLSDIHISNLSEPFFNAAYGSYYAPPYVETSTPVTTAPISATQSYQVTVTYTENLKKADESAPAGVIFTAQHEDTPYYAKVENFVWDENSPDTVSFLFTPSAMYQHRFENYSFYLTNLIGEESGKTPNALTYITEQPNVVCNKMFGDGTLYMKVYGHPSLVSSEDLSLTGWKTADGNYVSENQRSQLMLVVNETSAADGAAMTQSAAQLSGVAQSDVLSAKTYELQLDLCSQIVTIPDGSYMQLAFGFPEGYGPEDAGVTFRAYHFKRGADGAINYAKTEELNCVVTEYGIIVTVTDFSPFALLAVRQSAVSSTDKGIYARTVGFGGHIDGNTVASVPANGSITYNFVPESGYRVDRVLLNGEAVQITDNSLTLDYDALGSNNTLNVWFVAERIAAAEEEQGIAPVYPSVKVTQTTSAVAPVEPSEPPADADDTAKTPDGDRTLVIVVVVCVCAVILIIILALILLSRSKKRRRSKKRSSGKSSSKKTAKKTSAKKK